MGFLGLGKSELKAVLATTTEETLFKKIIGKLKKSLQCFNTIRWATGRASSL